MRWGRTQQISSPTAIRSVNLLRVVGFLSPYRRRFLLILLTVTLAALLGLIPPLVVGSIIDNAIAGADRSLLLRLAVALVVIAIASGLVGVLRSYLNTTVSQRIMYDLKIRMYRRLQSLSLKFYTDHQTGELMSRLTSDIAGIDNIISGTLVSIISNILILTSTLALMFAISWQFTLLALIVLPWLILPTFTVGRLRRRLRRERQQQNAAVNAQMAENLSISGTLLIKTFTREHAVMEQFTEDNHRLMNLQVRESLVGRWYFMLLTLVTTAGPAIIYWYGGGQIIGGIGEVGGMTIGIIVAFVALMGRLYNPATELMSLHVDVMTSLAYFERIFQYLDLEPDIADAPDAKELPETKGSITFEHVTLEYVPGTRAVDDVSMEVEPGQLVALVGPSGAGKTSLTYLIPRLYDATEGRILVDGHDIRQVTQESLRRQIGVVTQETFLFHASVADNLRFAKPNATEEEMDAACKAAYISDVIHRLPDGFDTLVGERGYRLSVGEKQRLAIARILLKDTRIFLLDEATASLDSHSERAIQRALAPLMRGRTSIVIAHRLSTILAADVILYVDNGRVMEQGSHQDLLARNGLYTSLYEEQFKPAQHSVGN
jgi:ATP-binding cassette subfamily B protein